MIDNIQNENERALLVGIDTGDYDSEVSIAELEELARTAGAVTIGKVIQNRTSPNTATFVGKGKLEEIAEICENDDINLVIFDSELSASHLRNVEKVLPDNCRVIDRTMLILDIFAGRAKSSEGRLQVELAQLQYILPRLTGLGTSLSRLGGGIGTRGPGETQLETDRRHIRRRINSLKRQIKEIAKHREKIRKRWEKDGVLTVAIVGYTNAGKSTLMNLLTNAGVLTENKLFATLDPTARALTLPDGREVLLIDTVGFVRRLPHHLVEAFRSTLEEAAKADVIINLCDASSAEAKEHLEVTTGLLEDLNDEEKEPRPIFSVFNKIDLLEEKDIISLPKSSVKISSVTGEGIDELLNAIQEAFPKDRKLVHLLIPFSEGSLAERCRQAGTVQSEEFTNEGVKMSVILSYQMIELVKDCIVEK